MGMLLEVGQVGERPMGGAEPGAHAGHAGPLERRGQAHAGGLQELTSGKWSAHGPSSFRRTQGISNRIVGMIVAGSTRWGQRTSPVTAGMRSERGGRTR